MSNTNKIMLLTFLLVVVIVLIRSVIWTKGLKDEDDAGIIKTSPDILLGEFVKDAIQAKQYYISKTLQVSGEVADTFADHLYRTIILLTTGTPGVFINCTLDQKEVNVKRGASITVKGVFDTYDTGNPETQVPGAINLINCYLL
ncbi:OB-fold putative lipoprotein [Ferruginibacter lapsinanis]|uniref:OB-fold putative lipoprotein n=1 Tax=Ferruginibacter lapsinanis TaxID=563172 RepID=UPI001E422480|nr:OB-fold putative lipoprotein [Ferruginibacter lapsinanis]UEG50603.1 OB-fold putative lipoprotein [Ferruginibacter lapsinanis]